MYSRLVASGVADSPFRLDFIHDMYHHPPLQSSEQFLSLKSLSASYVENCIPL
jgi:hypothetical protein